VLYLVCAGMLFLPCLYLYKFSIKMQLAVKSVNQENFDESLMNLKSMFKFYGILTIVLLSFYVLIFVISMLTIAMKG
jgi:predicted ferric reductase